MSDLLKFDLDTSGIARISEAMQRGKNRTPDAIRRAINHTGDIARTHVGRELVKQTGLKYGVIRRALKTMRANYGTLWYTIRVRGGNIKLKYFGARETAKGVSAAPWGHRQVFPGTFIKAGRFPNRVTLSMGGQVFKRIGTSRLPIELVRSGVFIPTELTKGATAEAFMETVRTRLPARVEHEVGAVLSGAVR